MIHDGEVKGLPLREFVDTKGNCVLLPSKSGMVALAQDTGELGFHDGQKWNWIRPLWGKIVLWKQDDLTGDNLQYFEASGSGLDAASQAAEPGDWIFLPPGRIGPVHLVLKSGVHYRELISGTVVLWNDGSADSVIATSEEAETDMFLSVRGLEMAGAVGTIAGLSAVYCNHPTGLTLYLSADILCQNLVSPEVEATACGLRVTDGSVDYRGNITVLSTGKHYGAYGIRSEGTGTLRVWGDIHATATRGFAYCVQLRNAGRLEWHGDGIALTQGPASWPEYPDSGYAVVLQTRNTADATWYGNGESTAEQSDCSAINLHESAEGRVIARGDLVVSGADRGVNGIAVYGPGSVDFIGTVTVNATGSSVAYGIYAALGSVVCTARVTASSAPDMAARGLYAHTDGTITALHCTVTTSGGSPYDLYCDGGTLYTFATRYSSSHGPITPLLGLNLGSVTGAARGALITGNDIPRWSVLPHPGSAGRVLQTTDQDVAWSSSELVLSTSLTNQGGPGVLNWPADGATLTVPGTGTCVLGSGTAGHIAQWADTNTLTASALVTQGGQGTLSWPPDGATLTIPATGTAVLGGGTSGYLPYWASDNELGTSGIYWDAANGRVGIGTTSPVATVEVVGGLRVSAGVQIFGTVPRLYMGEDSSQYGVISWNPTYKILAFGMSGWYTIYLTSQGRVSVGTNIYPSSKFEVDDYTQVSNSVYRVAGFSRHTGPSGSGLTVGGGIEVSYALETATAGDRKSALLTQILWSDATSATATALFRLAVLGNNTFDASCGFWSHNAVGGSAITVIPNIGSDVTGVLTVVYAVAENTGGGTSGSIATVTPGNYADIYNDGTDVLRLTVNTDGSATITRASGSDTFRVGLWMTWI